MVSISLDIGFKLTMKKKSTLWFTRQHGIIRGPFPVKVIKNNLLLNRLDANKDEISTDQLNWHLIYSQSIFNTPNIHKLTKKQLDERDGFDRRNPLSTDEVIPQQREGERRTEEYEHEIKSRQLRTLIMKRFQQKQHNFWPLLTLFIFASGLLLFAIKFAIPLPSSTIDCNQPAGINVNWTNCIKPRLSLPNQNLSHAHLRNSQLGGSNFMNTLFTGSDMAYSDLQSTNLSYSQLDNVSLIGANLQNADLSYTNLSGSDLSYTDLTNANLGGSKFDDVRFDHAIWTNGQYCQVESIGRCIIVDK